MLDPGTTVGPDQTAGAQEYVAEKHYMRKHGPNAYYGQKNR